MLSLAPELADLEILLKRVKQTSFYVQKKQEAVFVTSPPKQGCKLILEEAEH